MENKSGLLEELSNALDNHNAMLEKLATSAYCIANKLSTETPNEQKVSPPFVYKSTQDGLLRKIEAAVVKYDELNHAMSTQISKIEKLL